MAIKKVGYQLVPFGYNSEYSDKVYSKILIVTNPFSFKVATFIMYRVILIHCNTHSFYKGTILRK